MNALYKKFPFVLQYIDALIASSNMKVLDTAKENNIAWEYSNSLIEFEFLLYSLDLSPEQQQILSETTEGLKQKYLKKDLK